jgi:hypothetical protein
MRKYTVCKIWISALLVAVTMTGCSDPEKNASAGNPGDPLTPPTVTAVTPPDTSIGNCLNNVLITATFSKPMNPATININTFTLTQAGASVPGAVAYVASSQIATFTPSGNLAASLPFVATINTGVADTFGNHLAANFTWTFTTSAAVCAPPGGAIALGASCSFGILGATPSVTSAGPTIVTGDVGIWPAASIVGFPPGTLTGTKHAADGVAQTAQGDLTIAYNNAAAAAGGIILPADAGGLTLAPGVYKTTSAQPTLGITGNLTLSGPANGVWIFQVVSALTTAAGNSQVIMSGGATSHNVFWQIGSSATLGTNTTFAGTIMAHSSITVTTGATLNGRALASTGAVTLDSNPVNVPACP